MTYFYRTSVALLLTGLLLVLASCSGPAAAPQEQPKAAAAPTPDERPATVEQAPAPVEQPRQQIAASKPAAAPKPAPKRVVPPPPPQPQPQPAAPAPTASSAPAAITLPAPVAPPVEAPAATPIPDEVKPIPVEPPPPRVVKVPSGTLVAVRMIDSIDSETGHVGESFKASLDAPIVVDKDTVFPKGAEVYVKLTKVESAGRVSGTSELQVQLDRIFLGKKSYTVESNTYTNTGTGQGGRTARSAGIGAAIGAAIGAISGGGKGAVIGGATGAGAGAGVEAVRKGEQVRVDSESRLDFRLESPLDVTLDPAAVQITPQKADDNSGPVRFGTPRRRR